jgi:hypothetical protein
MSKLILFLAIGFLVSFGLAVLVGKCIAFGMGTDLEEKEKNE